MNEENKKDNRALKDNELEEVNGGMMPFIVLSSNEPGVEPRLSTSEHEEVKSEKNTFVPIPY